MQLILRPVLLLLELQLEEELVAVGASHVLVEVAMAAAAVAAAVVVVVVGQEARQRSGPINQVLELVLQDNLGRHGLQHQLPLINLPNQA